MALGEWPEGWTIFDTIGPLLDENSDVSYLDDYLGSPDCWLNIDDGYDPEDEGQPSK